MCRSILKYESEEIDYDYYQTLNENEARIYKWVHDPAYAPVVEQIKRIMQTSQFLPHIITINRFDLPF